MRLFEILIVLLDMPLLGFAFASHASQVWMSLLLPVVILVIVLHWIIEGYRWQMVPAYVSSVLLTVIALMNHGQHPAITVSVIVTAAVLLLASSVLATILPVFSLPEPDGPNVIGTIAQQWTVPNELGRTGQSSPRKLNIQFWYPAEAKNGKRSPYRAADARGLKAHLRLTRTHATVNAPVSRAQGRYPVVLFSPGWKGHLTQNTIQFEMLASHGFIVLAIEHPPAENLPLYFDASREENLRGYAVEVKLRARDVQLVLDQLKN